MLGYLNLPTGGRYTLLCIVILALAVNLALASTGVSPREAFLTETMMLLALSLFTVHPPVAAILLILAGLATSDDSTIGPCALMLAAVSGLVVFTCNLPVSLFYAASAIAAVVLAYFTGGTIGIGGAVAIVCTGFLSALIGASFRKSVLRVVALKDDNSRLLEKSKAAIHAERERLADELHNVIAHDLTIVAMHARALEFAQTSEDRLLSVDAIAIASTQALTDIRRMLKIIHAEDSSILSRANETIVEVIHATASELEDVGIKVEVSTEQHLDVSRTIHTTLVHLLRECATNILKHAADSQTTFISLRQIVGFVEFAIRNVVSDQPRPQAVGSGYGLKRMEERVNLLGGAFEVESSESSWQVTARLPLR